MNEPKVEAGVVVGNTYDKYGSRNPLARLFVGGFLSSFDRLVGHTGATRVLEVGCGEGELALRLARAGKQVVASDISGGMIQLARARAREENLAVDFRVADVLTVDPERESFDLVVCCEVLEHLMEPEAALARLSKIAAPYLLVSVPREPLWRLLNLARLSYISELGNTPGHVQHWSRRGFRELVSRYATVVREETPMPWTMLLVRSS